MSPGEYSNTFWLSSALQGSPPMTFQWLKDGVAIPGATSYNYVFNNAGPTDYGTYSIKVRQRWRPRDVAAVSADGERRLSGAGPLGGCGAARRRGPFSFRDTTPRLERYNLATDAWLPAVTLTPGVAPSAIAPADEGIYIAYERRLVRRSPDLATETVLIDAPPRIQHVFIFESWVYYSLDTGGLLSRRARDGPAH